MAANRTFRASSLLWLASGLPLIQGQNASSSAESNQYLKPLPEGFSGVSAAYFDNHLAVIPDSFVRGNISSGIYNVETRNESFQDALSQSKEADFLAWDESFFEFIGKKAKLERIQSFPEGQDHVHEAPIYLPDTNEVLFSDTSVTGWLWATNIETFETRKLDTNPPLANVNGGTSQGSTLYLTTNGGPARGLHRIDSATGETTTILNNFRGRHLNSPNDLVVNSAGNIYFTDPKYGILNGFVTEQPQELPEAIYHFNTRTGALTALDNRAVRRPNGLALSLDERTLYVGDSNSTPTGGLSSVRNVYAFDLEGATVAASPRLVHQTDSGRPDGMRVTESGFLMVAVDNGVEVVDPATGLLLGKINCPGDMLYNLTPATGDAAGQWLLTGRDYIYKVTIQEGPASARPRV